MYSYEHEEATKMEIRDSANKIVENRTDAQGLLSIVPEKNDKSVDDHRFLIPAVEFYWGRLELGNRISCMIRRLIFAIA